MSKTWLVGMRLMIKVKRFKYDCVQGVAATAVLSPLMFNYQIGSKRDADRYIARRLDAVNWCVWDTRRDEPVFETEMLREEQAQHAARRLSQAYRKAIITSGEPCPGA